MPLDLLRSPAAESDLIDIWLYTSQHWGERQADDYLDMIDETLRLIAANPECGTDIGEIRSGYRSFRVGQHRIYYRVVAGAIEVVRILHPKMDVVAQLER